MKKVRHQSLRVLLLGITSVIVAIMGIRRGRGLSGAADA
jgi:hypothetical protein